VTTVTDKIALATIRNVPVAKVGPARLWKGGEREFTDAELIDAVAASNDPEIGAPRVKLAHEHQLDTGEPSFGTYTDLRYDAEKRTVFADLKGVPVWLAKVLPTFYPNRSFEASENVSTSTGAYKLAFRAIGSLGIKMPAIKGLSDLAHWATAEMPDGVTLNAAEGTDTPAWADTAIEPETGKSGEAINVDIREKLGLPKEATDEQVLAKLDEQAALAKAGSPEAIAKVKDDAIKEAQAAADAAAAAKIAEAEAKAQADAQEAEKKRLAESGMVLVEAAAYEEIKAQAQAGAGAAATINRQRREALIDGKIAKGAVAPASRDKLIATLEAGGIDEETIAGLPDGVLPIDKKALGQEDTNDVEGADGSDDAWMLGFLREDERAALKGASA
jgi:hypothetical protein